MGARSRRVEVIKTAVIAIATAIAATTTAHAQSHQTPIYDANGHYAGSVHIRAAF
jgi:hypothetical protein